MKMYKYLYIHLKFVSLGSECLDERMHFVLSPLPFFFKYHMWESYKTSQNHSRGLLLLSSYGSFCPNFPTYVLFTVYKKGNNLK